MTAPKVTLEKATLLNIHKNFCISITNLREELSMWTSWNDATSEGYHAKAKKRHILKHQEGILRNLEQMIAGRKQRERKGAKKDGTRLLLVMCGDCGYKLRTTQLWLAVGVPKCPNTACNKYDEEMNADDTFYGQEEMTIGEAIEMDAERNAEWAKQNPILAGLSQDSGDINDPFSEAAQNASLEDFSRAVKEIRSLKPLKIPRSK